MATRASHHQTGLIYLDTCAVIWLREGHTDWLSRDARHVIETCDLLISPMVMLELSFLADIGRIKLAPQSILDSLEGSMGLRVCDWSWPAVVKVAMGERWTTDPFDRMITSHAKSRGEAPLLTADDTIRRNYPKAIL